MSDAMDGRQRGLFDLNPTDFTPIVEEADPRAGTITERAERFHAANPQIYAVAVKIARGIKAAGMAHYGIGAVWEILRYQSLHIGGDIYRLNNNYRAFYARLIMQQEPDLEGFFATRDCPHDAEYATREARAS